LPGYTDWRFNPEVSVMEYYSSSVEHLLDETGRIALKVRLELLKKRLATDQQNRDDFLGLYISEEEVDRLLTSTSIEPGYDTASDLNSPALESLTDRLNQLEKRITERKAASQANGVILRIVELGKMFQLSAYDIDSLLICLLPELQLEYEKLYSYLQDDITKKRPSVELVLRLLGLSAEERLMARKAFSPQAPLIKNHLLRFDDEEISKLTPLLALALKVDERILNYLLGSDEIDPRILSCTQHAESQMKLADVVLPDDIKDQLLNLMNREDNNLICYLQGPYGVGKQTAAEALFREFNMPLLIINVRRLLDSGLPFDTATRLVYREAILQNAALYWKHFDALLVDNQKLNLDILTNRLKDCPMMNILAGETIWQDPEPEFKKPFVKIQIPMPAYEARTRLWQLHLNGHLPASQDINLEALSNKFAFSGGQIRDAVASTENLALLQASRQVSMTDLYNSCRAQSSHKLRTLTQKVESRYNWDDIILPQEQLDQLHEITSYVKYRHIVYGEWDFNEKLSLGKGLNALFAGPSGTGKTMAAGIIANELKLDMYKIDLSAVVSKYIGETEKNLKEIFDEAETSNTILFFDEADALFGKRSEVRDAHDRYANIEISYLLQKMEEYEGIVILATNLHKNMDEAFVRRMHFVVEFPSPEEEHRFAIWSNIFPQKAPLDKSVDFRFLAKQFKITGGNIRNTALSASFLAAEGGRNITMKHIILATKREFQKMSKLYSEADFGKYYSLIKSVK
jgi:ATP-dependent 26S proteasome regulatory subunit